MEQRGEPDTIDYMIFAKKTPVNGLHVAATPTALVTARNTTFTAWKTWVLTAMHRRLLSFAQELRTTDTDSERYTLLIKAQKRVIDQYNNLRNTTYDSVSDSLIAVPEQDILLLAQWSESLIMSGDECTPRVTILLDDVSELTFGACCGDVAAVLKDHMYWQEVIEAGWAAVDADPAGRIQPVWHTNDIGEKFHFYKTKYSVYFRETLSADEQAPGDLYRIVKYPHNDPRYDREAQGAAEVIWLKFPHDEAYDPSENGRYNPAKIDDADTSLEGCYAERATWAYKEDALALFARQP
jgi:hypothetical protein